jgi:sialate O-acetylesterase
MDKKSLQPFTGVKVPVANDGIKADRMRPTCLFNGMIAPVVGFGIKGFLWYQGEANVSHEGSHPYNYDKMMMAMVHEWRKLWNRNTLPFYFVQIAPWKYRHNKDSVPYLRAAQQRAQRKIPNSGMVVTVDIGSPSTVHPPDKTTVSKRLLYWALGDTYQKKGIAYRSPVYKDMKIDNNSIMIAFTNAPHGFTSFGEEITGFEIAGADHIFHPAQAKIFHEAILVQSHEVSNPVAVRYVFKDWAAGNLYNTAGLPVAPFRTDNW